MVMTRVIDGMLPDATGWTSGSGDGIARSCCQRLRKCWRPQAPSESWDLGHKMRCTGHMVMLDDVGGSMMFQACFVLIPTNVRMIRWSQGIVFGFLRGLNHRPSRFVAICRISLGTAKAKYPQAIDFERYLTRSHTESALDAPPTP
jgi:hypothetical protein